MSFEDYGMLVNWWTANKFPPPGLDDLPISQGQLQGIIVSNDGIDICAGFLINTNVPNGAMVEYIVANFEVKNRHLRKDALNYLINAISSLAKKIGKKYLFTSLKHPSLKQRYLDCDFKIGSTGTMEMIKQL